MSNSRLKNTVHAIYRFKVLNYKNTMNKDLMKTADLYYRESIYIEMEMKRRQSIREVNENKSNVKMNKKREGIKVRNKW